MSTRRVLVNAVLILVFAAACITGMEYLAVNIGQQVPGWISSPYRVQAVFTDANGIPVSADVRVAGVVVGKVSGIGHDPSYPGATVVTMQINDHGAVPVIYSNGFAKVRPKTLLGEKYVDLVVGTQAGEAIPSGGTLGEARTSVDVENDTIFNSFDAQTRELQKQVLADLDVATQQRAGDLQAILPQLEQVVHDLDPLAQVYTRDDQNSKDIFSQLDTVMQALADEHTQLAGLLANGNVALGAIAQRNDALARTLQEYSNVAQEFLTAGQPTVAAQRASLQRLAPTLDSLRSFLDAVDGPHCNGQPCGLDTLVTGTLTGQVAYPNDQLTVTSGYGNIVTNWWASMFSKPENGYKSNPGSPRDPNASHSALSLVLSVECDSGPQQLAPIFAAPTIGPLLQQQFTQTCTATTGQGSASSHQPSGTSGSSAPSGQQATVTANGSDGGNGSGRT